MTDLTFKSMRRNSFTSVVSWEDMAGAPRSSHASDWWNGEGIDFTLLNDKKEGQDKTVSLDMDELHVMLVQAVAFGMVDLDLVKQQAASLEKDMLKKESVVSTLNTTDSLGL